VNYIRQKELYNHLLAFLEDMAIVCVGVPN